MSWSMIFCAREKSCGRGERGERAKCYAISMTHYVLSLSSVTLPKDVHCNSLNGKSKPTDCVMCSINKLHSYTSELVGRKNTIHY